MEVWLKNSWFFQQDMFKNVKDRYWEHLEEDSIKQNIMYALSKCYGEDFLEKKAYKELPNKIAEKIFNHCPVDKKKDKRRFFSCTFINMWLIDDKEESIECVFWTQDNNGTNVCIDTNCRNYNSWVDFKENNVLPESYLIFPIAGRYTNEIGSDFNYKELVFAESVSCKLKSKIKNYVDKGAQIGALAAAGMLACNPVSLPVTIPLVCTSVIGSVVSTGFAVGRLVDKSEHEGLSLDYESIFAVSDVVISAVGVAAVGVTGGCKVLAASEKFLCNSAIVLKIGSSTATVCKAMMAVHGINDFVNVIMEYKEKGCINLKSLKLLKLTINFIFRISVSLPLVKKLIEYISRQSLDNFVDCLSKRAHHVFSYVKTGITIDDDFNRLVQLLIPSELPMMKRIFDTPIVKYVCKVIKTIKQLDTKDPLKLTYDLMNLLPELLKEIDTCFLQSNQEVVNDFGEETGSFINKWALSGGINIGSKQSSYENKINFLGDLTNKVDKTLMSLDVIENKDYLKEKKYFLLNTVMRLLFQHNMKTYNYAISKANYYCNKFSEIFTKLMDNYHADHFVCACKNISDDSTNGNITYELKNEELIDYVFNETIELLYKSSDHLHDSYELSLRNSSHVEPSEETESVFKFKVPKSNLNEELCYDTTVIHLPSLSSKLTKDRTVFESHFDQLAIITSNDGTFKLIFYFIENGDNLDGLLMYIK